MIRVRERRSRPRSGGERFGVLFRRLYIPTPSPVVLSVFLGTLVLVAIVLFAVLSP